jgi:hypothetical protein
VLLEGLQFSLSDAAEPGGCEDTGVQQPAEPPVARVGIGLVVEGGR